MFSQQKTPSQIKPLMVFSTKNTIANKTADGYVFTTNAVQQNNLTIIHNINTTEETLCSRNQKKNCVLIVNVLTGSN